MSVFTLSEIEWWKHTKLRHTVRKVPDSNIESETEWLQTQLKNQINEHQTISKLQQITRQMRISSKPKITEPKKTSKNTTVSILINDRGTAVKDIDELFFDVADLFKKSRLKKYNAITTDGIIIRLSKVNAIKKMVNDVCFEIERELNKKLKDIEDIEHLNIDHVKITYTEPDEEWLVGKKRKVTLEDLDTSEDHCRGKMDIKITEFTLSEIEWWLHAKQSSQKKDEQTTLKLQQLVNKMKELKAETCTMTIQEEGVSDVMAFAIKKLIRSFKKSKIEYITKRIDDTNVIALTNTKASEGIINNICRNLEAGMAMYFEEDEYRIHLLEIDEVKINFGRSEKESNVEEEKDMVIETHIWRTFDDDFNKNKRKKEILKPHLTDLLDGTLMEELQKIGWVKNA